MNKDQPASVVIYGNRRMGKTSILQNLSNFFDKQMTIIDFNPQRINASNANELLYALADSLHYNLSAEARATIDEPSDAHFKARNPYIELDHFLRRLDQERGEQKFLIAMDEFDEIEDMIREGMLPDHFLGYLRSLIQTYRWFILVFAGLHTLQEMTEDYWNPLFASVKQVRVGFLDFNAARQLITQPTPGFGLRYEPAAMKHIFYLTNGQPFLTQLVGHTFVMLYNRRVDAGEIKRMPQITVADVDSVCDTPEFYGQGDSYFSGIWQRAEKDPVPHQTAVLRALSRFQDGATVEELTEYVDVEPSTIIAALDTLDRHDVVWQDLVTWRFSVELMRRWVAQRRDA